MLPQSFHAVPDELLIKWSTTDRVVVSGNVTAGADNSPWLTRLGMLARPRPCTASNLCSTTVNHLQSPARRAAAAGTITAVSLVILSLNIGSRSLCTRGSIQLTPHWWGLDLCLSRLLETNWRTKLYFQNYFARRLGQTILNVWCHYRSIWKYISKDLGLLIRQT